MTPKEAEPAYADTGVRAQTACPHRIRNRDGSECATCGSRVVAGRWRYLTPEWFAYYADGAARPKA